MGRPWLSVAQSSGIFSPFLLASSSLPPATLESEMSSTNGNSPKVGIATASGLLPTTGLLPPGATTFGTTLVMAMPIIPASAAMRA